jgi:hypothetical protein
VARLTADDVACWVLKTAGPVALTGELTRCVRPSYRLDLMAAGQPCLLWRSGRDAGVHALGELTGPVLHPVESLRHENRSPATPLGGPVVPVRFAPLAEPVTRAELLTDPAFRGAEVVRMPAGSNPSWLDAAQYAAVLARAGQRALGPWGA